MSKSSFDINDVKTINATLLESQVDLILKSLINSKDRKLNRICSKPVDDIQIASQLHITLNSTEEKILNLINREKYITQAEISKLLWLSENCIYKNIKKLKVKGIIERIGSNKNGYWKILN